jgi:hypothetical protein
VVLGQPNQQHSRLHRELRVELDLAPTGLRRVQRRFGEVEASHLDHRLLGQVKHPSRGLDEVL